jgi:DNA invertase Pin-like site-specific DNA recombinase
MKRCVAYVRVSTQGQDTESQLVAIKTAIEKSGDLLLDIYKDHGISGAKGRDQRPALDKMLKDAKAQKFDKVVAFDITRLGRSLPDLIATLNELSSANVDLQMLQNNLDTSTAGGRMMFSIFGAIGEFERSLIRERVKAGLENAKKNGTRLGRPTNCTPQTEATVKELRDKGFSIRKICSLLKISVQKYYDIMGAQTEFSMQN